MASRLTSSIIGIHDSLLNYYGSDFSHCNSIDLYTERTASEEELEESNYFESLRNAGFWQIRRFEKFSWSSRRQKHISNLRRFSSIVLDDNEKNGILSQRMIGASLSYLERCPEVNVYAYCKCVLADHNLLDISAIETYHFIQYLDLSNNNLTSLAPLSQLPFLQYIDANTNKLEVLLDFRAPLILSFVNYSRNLLTEIPDLTAFWSITHLYLSQNRIAKIQGLENLRYLSHLDLSFNAISKIENLDYLRIQTLHLNNNQIEDLEEVEANTSGLSKLPFIKTIDLATNNLQTLQLVKNVENMENLNVSNNEIKGLMEIEYLRHKRYLNRLDLSSNPIGEFTYYPVVCVRTIPHLGELDGEILTPEQRILAQTSSTIDHLKQRQEAMELLLLQQINYPQIGAHVWPYDESCPTVIVFVGPPASRKKKIIKKFVKTHPRLCLGVSHTTRHKRPHEEEGEDYYFVSREQFKELVRTGHFLALSEFNGNCFGIAHAEMEKAINKIIVFHSDLNTALILRFAGIAPRLLLAMPRSEETHRSWICQSYSYKDITDEQVEIYYAYDTANEPDVKSAAEDNKTDPSVIFTAVGDSFDLEDEDDFEERTLQTERSTIKASGILKSQDFVLKEKLEAKRVSFNWLTDHIVQETTKMLVPEVPEVPKEMMKTTGSISQTLILESRSDISVPTSYFSAISSHKINDTEKTEYMTVSERFDKIQQDVMDVFIKGILDSRDEYMQLFWDNPGLFRDLIFTDDNDYAAKLLNDILKGLIENHSVPVNKISIEKDPIYEETIKAKLRCLKINEEIFYRKQI